MIEFKNLSWFRDPRQWLRAMLMLDDSSHRIALGGAIGMFIALTPTVGIQMLLVLLLAVTTQRWFRFNKVAALLMVYVSNPLTVVPIYWFSYKLGTIYFPGHTTRREFEAIFQYDDLAEWWASLTKLFVDVGLPLVAGSLVMATCCGLATYPILLRVIRNLRRAERRALKARKAEKKRQKQAEAAEPAGAERAAAKASTEPAEGAAQTIISLHPARQSVGVQRRSPV
jgi:uncharacterized protein